MCLDYPADIEPIKSNVQWGYTQPKPLSFNDVMVAISKAKPETEWNNEGYNL